MCTVLLLLLLLLLCVPVVLDAHLLHHGKVLRILVVHVTSNITCTRQVQGSTTLQYSTHSTGVGDRVASHINSNKHTANRNLLSAVPYHYVVAACE